MADYSFDDLGYANAGDFPENPHTADDADDDGSLQTTILRKMEDE